MALRQYRFSQDNKERWRAETMECYSYLRNVQDLLACGQNPSERRIISPFQCADYSICSKK